MIQKLCAVLVALIAFQLSCGFDVNNVLQLNNEILQSVDDLKTKDDCENLISSIRKFIGGLHFTMLEILHYYNKTQSLRVGKCIIDKEKPEFIDKLYNLTRMEIICGWETEDVRYFKKVMSDANNTWTKFVNAYVECKDKPVMLFNFKQVSVYDDERLNDEIIETMEAGNCVNDSSQLINNIASYSGGMVELTMNIVKGSSPEETLKVCDEIYKFGKPNFLDYKFDVSRKRKPFHWSDEDETFFNNIMLDAKSVWSEFIENYKKMKKKYSSLENK